MTVKGINDDIGISKDSVHVILLDELGLRRVVVKFVPKLITRGQREVRPVVSQYMLETVNRDVGFHNILITGDETWVYG